MVLFAARRQIKGYSQARMDGGWQRYGFEIAVWLKFSGTRTEERHRVTLSGDRLSHRGHTFALARCFRVWVGRLTTRLRVRALVFEALATPKTAALAPGLVLAARSALRCRVDNGALLGLL
jgi:hypothetical protein